ncbi:MAG: hypothetical protein KGK44_06020 [Gammaproteobacteria bacterium]|nr:hypothetical protein [Gammaproteobacteria bacterium]
MKVQRLLWVVENICFTISDFAADIVYWYLLPIEPVNYILQTSLPVAIHGTSLQVSATSHTPAAIRNEMINAVLAVLPV